LIVGQVESDERGRVEVPVTSEKIGHGAAALTLMVNHQAVETPEALHALGRALSGAGGAEAAGGARGASPTPPAVTKAMFLYGVALKNAERTTIETAVERAGGRRVLTGGSKNISQFDVALLDIPGKQRLKFMFDGHDHFVQAKYQGRVTDEKHRGVVSALVERYGAAQESSANGAKSYGWTFDDGLALTYRLEDSRSGQSSFSLSYVDITAEAALRDTVKAIDEKR
jgi:hypothetical protein